MGDSDAEGVLDFRLVQHGVVRARRLGRILVGVQGRHAAGADARQAVYGEGEVVPRADAFVAEVVDAGRDALFDGGVDGSCQVARVGGGAYLVEHHTQLRHGLDEVVAILRVEPGGADDHGARASSRHLFLARQLGASVDGVGAGERVLRVGHVGGAVEDVVRGDVYQGGAARFGRIGQMGGSQVV